MSRSLSAAYIVEKDKLANARPVTSFVFHFGGTVGDVYVSDREVTIGGNAHTAAASRVGEYQSSIAIRQGTFTVKSMQVELINFPLFASDKRFSDLWQGVGPEGIEVDVYENLLDDASAYHSDLLFKAVMRPVQYDPHQCQVELVSISEKYLEKTEVSEPINNTDFPNADIDDIGKRANLIFGSVKKVRAHAVVAGPASTFRQTVGTGDTTIPIHDDFYDALPTTGTIQGGNEKMTYTGKGGSAGSRTLTGVTRGALGSTVESHLKDDTILQVLTEYVYQAAGRPVKDITRVYIKRREKEIPLAAAQYTVELANTTLVSGKTLSLIKFSAPPLVAEKSFVELIDDIDVLDTIDVSQANSETQWEDVASDINVTFPETEINEDIQFQSITVAATKTKSSGNYVKRFNFLHLSGTMHSSVLSVNESGFQLQSGSTPVASNPVTTVGGVTTLTLKLARAGATSHPAVTFRITSRSVRYAIDSSVDKTGSASKTGSVFLSSQSTAELVIGDAVLFDADGMADDGSGTYTGTPDALIEKPADVLHYFAREIVGIPSGLVNASSFTTARTDSPATYKFGLVISERTQAKELLIAMGMQSRIKVDWPVDKLTAQFIPSAYGAAVKVVTQNDIVVTGSARGSKGPRKTTLNIQRGDANDIINRLSVYYGREWDKGRGRDAFKKVTQKAENAASLAKYGAREQADRFLFDFIAETNTAMAEDLRDFYRDFLAEAPRILSATCLLNQYELLPGDVIGVSFFTRVATGAGQFPYTFPISFGEAGELFDGLNGSQKFLVEDLRVMPGNYRDKRITHTEIKAREVQ